jgi:hypothetical protein
VGKAQQPTTRSHREGKRRQQTAAPDSHAPFCPPRESIRAPAKPVACLSPFVLFIPQYSAAQDRTAQDRPHWWHRSHRVYLSAICSSRAATAPGPAARLVFSHHDTVMQRSVLSHAMARPNVGLPCQELARRSSRNKRARRRPGRAMVRAGSDGVPRGLTILVQTHR